MLCNRCGGQLKEGANFCGKCGQRVDGTIPDPTIAAPTTSNTEYTMYVPFNFQESIISKVFSAFLGTDSNTGSYRIVRSYVITNKSIIINGTEFYYDDIQVFSPRNNMVCFKINNVTYSLYDSLQDRHKLFFALYRANNYFDKSTPRAKLQYINMGYYFLKQVKWVYRKVLYITFDGNRVFNELWQTYQMKMIDKTGEATDEQKFWIEKYNQVAQELDDYFKKENPIGNKGYNRQPETLEKIIDLMSDFDTNMNEVVGRYNTNFQIEEVKRQERLERKAMEREANGNSFAGRTLSTAVGVVIGNKLSNNSKKQTEQHYYTCPLSCQFQYKVGGVPKCRLQSNKLTPDPSKCGHGYMYK